MRVCFVCPPGEFYSPVSGGAVATIAMQMAREFQRRGHQASVVTSANADPIYDVGEVISVHVPGREDLSFVQRRLAGCRRRLNRWDWPYYGGYLAALRRGLGQIRLIPDVLIVFNDLVAPRYLRRLFPAARLAVWLQNEQQTNQSPDQLGATIAATDVFLTCSQYIKEWTCRTHPIVPEHVVVARSGVDLETFRPPDDFPKRGETLKALFIGRIDPNKGPDLAVDAVTSLQRDGICIQMTVAGGLWFYGNGDPMADPFFRTLKGKMETARVNYLGHVDRTRAPGIIRGHDVAFVLSRSNEPFGLVALEAMASGCAVIASDRGGLPEACGGAAILVNPDNAAAVLAAFRSLSTDSNLLISQKTAALERARRAPWSACADVLEGALMAAPRTRGTHRAEYPEMK